MTSWIKPNNNLPNGGKDERVFKQGQIWSVSDGCIDIPDSEITGRTLRKIRPVIVVSDYTDNDNPDYPLLLVVPISRGKSASGLKDLSDVIVCPKDGVRKKCFVKVGLIQPILKVYLQRKLGELSVGAIDRVLGTLDLITGAELPQSSTENFIASETAAGRSYDESSH